MLAHLRANLLLIALTMLVGVVAFPAVLLGFGQVVFSDSANGNIVRGPDGKPLGYNSLMAFSICSMLSVSCLMCRT